MSPAEDRSLVPPMPPMPSSLSSAQLPRANPYQFTVRHMFLGAAFALLLLTVVVPNSLPIPTAVAMAVTFLLALPGVRFSASLRSLLALYACTVIVTIVYMMVGGMHGAAPVAMAEITVVYIVSPFAWMMIVASLYRQIGVDRIIEWLIALSALCVVSVGLFFYLYLTRGASAVTFFIQSANVNLNEGFSGATMYVYGSLIFLCGGFFSTPELIRNKLLRFSLLALFLICALTSGRSALILAIPIGWILGWMLASRTVEHVGKSAAARLLQYGLPTLVALVAALYLLQAYTQISISSVLDIVFNKVSSGGGAERSEMSRSLYEGIIDNGGLGAGHGVGVKYVSDPLHPWRYEVVWLATLYRVGIVGTVIYVLPFLLYTIGVIRLALARLLPARHKFMFCGFFCAFLATNTNPYIEAFALQWMYVVPLVLWYIEYPLILKRASS
jgi:hypothetical protein